MHTYFAKFEQLIRQNNVPKRRADCGFDSRQRHKSPCSQYVDWISCQIVNAGLSQYIGNCSYPVQVGLTSSESMQLKTMHMSKGQIWVGSIPPMAQILGDQFSWYRTSGLHPEDSGVRIPHLPQGSVQQLNIQDQSFKLVF